MRIIEAIAGVPFHIMDSPLFHGHTLQEIEEAGNETGLDLFHFSRKVDDYTKKDLVHSDMSEIIDHLDSLPRPFRGIGMGSSRGVYQYGDHLALKVALGRRGWYQNGTEMKKKFSYGKDSQYFSAVVAYGDSSVPNTTPWLVVEYAKSVDNYTEEDLNVMSNQTYGFDFKKILHFLGTIQSLRPSGTLAQQLAAYRQYADDDATRFSRLAEKKGTVMMGNPKFKNFLRFLVEQDFLLGDLTSKAQWGVVDYGGRRKLVICDYGITTHLYDRLY